MANEVEHELTDAERAALGAAMEAIDEILTPMPEHLQLAVLVAMAEVRIADPLEIPGESSS